MSKHEPRRQFKTPQQLDRSIAEAARISIDDRFVSASFVDYPDDFSDLVEWRRR